MWPMGMTTVASVSPAKKGISCTIGQSGPCTAQLRAADMGTVCSLHIRDTIVPLWLRHRRGECTKIHAVSIHARKRGWNYMSPRRPFKLFISGKRRNLKLPIMTDSLGAPRSGPVCLVRMPGQKSDSVAVLSPPPPVNCQQLQVVADTGQCSQAAVVPLQRPLAIVHTFISKALIGLWIIMMTVGLCTESRLVQALVTIYLVREAQPSGGLGTREASSHLQALGKRRRARSSSQPGRLGAGASAW